MNLLWGILFPKFWNNHSPRLRRIGSAGQRIAWKLIIWLFMCCSFPFTLRLKSWFLPKAEMNAGFQDEANNLVWLSWLSCWKCWWQPPCCDKSTRKNKKDGGTFVEELETPIVDADLGKQRILAFIAKGTFSFYISGDKTAESSAWSKERCLIIKMIGAWYKV